MITHETPGHNAAARRRAKQILRWVPVLLPALAVAAFSGCSKDAGKREEPAAATPVRAAECSLAMDTSAWTAFKDLADRIAAGQDVTKSDLNAFGNLPTVALWRDSMEPDSPAALRVGNWLEGTFWKELGRQGSQKMNPDRTLFTRSYRYSLDHRDRIDRRLAELTGPHHCDLMDIARFWIEPDRLPDTLTVHFLPAKAEIRIFNGSLLVDTGVVAAVSVDQVVRNMAALLYRKYQTLPGPNPIKVAGEQAVAQSFRVLKNEGVIGWIEQTVTFEFDSEHPALYKVKIIPEDFFLKTRETIGLMNRQLGPILNDQDLLTEKGLVFAETLAAMNSFSQTGYGMCAVIAARLGNERLRDASRSVPAFLAAYQEAALANPLPLPLPGDPDTELYQTVPALDPDIYTALHALLTRVFPAAD